MNRLLATLALVCLLGCEGAILAPEPLPGLPGSPVGPGPNGEQPTPEAPKCPPGTPIQPGRAPIRRLTRAEYNTTVRDLLGDTTNPASTLPAEEIGNGFGNDADAQSVSSLLASEWGRVAEGVATRATNSPAQLAKLHACTQSVTTANEAQCAREVIHAFATKAFRRPVLEDEVLDLLALEQSARAKASFPVALATVIEAVLQSPDFLYRVELGRPDPQNPGVRRPTGDEMAVRLSYLYWGTMPDPVLRDAAAKGELDTKAGVLAHATRMLADPRSRPVVRFFFDGLLPLTGLTDLERDKTLFPTFSAQIGAFMREESHRFLENAVFEGNGSWKEALTAKHTYVNGPLAAFYGIQGVTGTEWQRATVDTSQRLGVLTQASVMAGTTHSNLTSPVIRGAFLATKLMCRKIPLPTGALAEKVKPPEPTAGKTARERYSAHSSDPVCKGCHVQMDPLGLALENYDPVGLFRTTENGVTIDASGGVPGMAGTANGPVELMRLLAESPDTQACFASQWLTYAYGRAIGKDDVCTKEAVTQAFIGSGFNVRELLLALSQTDAFLYLPGEGT